MSEIADIIANAMRESKAWPAVFNPGSAEALTAAVLQALEDESCVIVRPYEKIIHRGEGADVEYQLVPTAQIETYITAIELLKARPR